MLAHLLMLLNDGIVSLNDITLFEIPDQVHIRYSFSGPNGT
jgi:hypothetical protein